jgi:hypothetical protein
VSTNAVGTGIWVVMMLAGNCVAFAQLGMGNHRVTVVVQEVTVLSVDIGTVNIQITGDELVAGESFMTGSEETSMLVWGTNASSRKVTASSNLATPRFVLKLAAINPTAGTPGSESVLSTSPSDFLLNIGRSSGTCRIRYTGEADASQGTGMDLHMVTFTIQAE